MNRPFLNIKRKKLKRSDPILPHAGLAVQYGRIASDEAKEKNLEVRTFFADLHRQERNDAPSWMEKQVYLSVGFFLLGVSALGLDACPIEGFDADILNDELGLAPKGLTASVIIPIGYKQENDFNAVLPKSRFEEKAVITMI